MMKSNEDAEGGAMSKRCLLHAFAISLLLWALIFAVAWVVL